MPYLLDANVFIQAKNLYYGFDICPGFWDWLIRANEQGKVYSIEKVGDELEAGNDELAAWARERGDVFFLRPDERVVQAFGRVSEWVRNAGYEPAAISIFLQGADYYLIAHALACNFIVVTHEVPASTKRKVKIPNVCIGLGIKHMTPYEMLRREGVKFVLAGSAL